MSGHQQTLLSLLSPPRLCPPAVRSDTVASFHLTETSNSILESLLGSLEGAFSSSALPDSALILQLDNDTLRLSSPLFGTCA